LPLLFLSSGISICRIVTCIVLRMSRCKLNHPVYHIVKEIPVMRHNHDGITIAESKLLQPVQPFLVQMVGRFIKQQQMWPAQPLYRQCEPGFLATTQSEDRQISLRTGKLEPAQGLLTRGPGTRTKVDLFLV